MICYFVNSGLKYPTSSKLLNLENNGRIAKQDCIERPSSNI